MRRCWHSIDEVVLFAHAYGYEGLHCDEWQNPNGPNPTRLLDHSGKCLAYWVWGSDGDGPRFHIRAFRMVEQDGAHRIYA